MNSRLPIICIMGSTCTGKTELAIHLENKFPLEIISVDSAMIYREMDIGTDKPPKNVLESVKHHLINIRNPNEDFNVADFFHITNELINDIHSRNKIPLLVGGSLMYFNSLYKGLSILPKKNISDRNLIDSLLEVYTLQDLHNCLKTIDVRTYNKIQANDKQRIQRALEVYMSSGKSISSLFKKKRPFFEFYDILTIKMFSSDRSIIHEKISSRMMDMFNQGLIDETQYLIEKYKLTSDSQSMKIIGYRHILDHLRDNSSIDDLKNKCLFATRQLAKRQITWLKQFPSNHSIDILDNDPTITYKAVDIHCNLNQ